MDMPEVMSCPNIIGPDYAYAARGRQLCHHQAGRRSARSSNLEEVRRGQSNGAEVSPKRQVSIGQLPV